MRSSAPPALDMHDCPPAALAAGSCFPAVDALVPGASGGRDWKDAETCVSARSGRTFTYSV